MKTPRDILFARHQAAAPKLDDIRCEVVRQLNNKETKEQSQAPFFVAWFFCCLDKIWQELFLPSRRVWSGLAAVWLLILAVNVAQHDASPAGNMTAAPAMMSFREQQRWMNELFADRAPTADAEPPKTFAPKPRTEIYQPIAT